jgi:hypothetical protein
LPTFLQIAAGGQISRFQVSSSFTVQDYEKAVNKASSAAGQVLPVAIWLLALDRSNPDSYRDVLTTEPPLLGRYCYEPFFFPSRYFTFLF